MFGIALSFTDFMPGIDVFHSPWIGLDNFQELFRDAFFFRALKNTIIISVMRVAICLPVAVIFAVLLNEIRSRTARTFIQSVSYIPFFISWVIVAIFFTTLLNPEYGVNSLLKQMGFPIISMGDAGTFRWIIVIADLWKTCGYNAILFTAAIMGIDTTLYEAVTIDGGNRWHKIWYIVLPSLRVTVLVVFILWIGTFVNYGFDQVFNMYNPGVYETGDILDTYIYRIAFSGSARYGLASAAGVVKGFVAMLMIFAANKFSKKVSGYGII